MITAQSDFCASLQKEWSILEAKYSRGTVKLLLEEGSAVPFPDPQGRPARLVLSEPHVFEIRSTAELTFTNAFWFEVVDEFSYSVSGIVRDEKDSFVGDKFRCYLASA